MTNIALRASQNITCGYALLTKYNLRLRNTYGTLSLGANKSQNMSCGHALLTKQTVQEGVNG